MQFKLGEINIVCTNLDESLKFYQDVLGFISKRDKEGFFHLRCGDQMFLLLPEAKERSFVTPYCDKAEFSLDLIVKDLKKAYNYFKDKNVSIAQDWHENAQMFVIQDPDGLHIEIIEILRENETL